MNDAEFHRNFRMSRDHAEYLSALLLPPGEKRPAYLWRIDPFLAVCMLLHRLATMASLREMQLQFRGLVRDVP
jgi:hypothetical protein